MKSCKLISGGESYDGKQGLSYFSGISAETANSEKLCMHIVTIPPGGSARPHYHEAHESAIFVLEGYSEMRHGPNLEHVMQIKAGISAISRRAYRTSPITRPTSRSGGDREDRSQRAGKRGDSRLTEVKNAGFSA